VRIELATTQPVRQAGAPAPNAPQKDKLGLTLRERLWVTRAALLAMGLSVVTSAVLVTMLPEDPRGPSGAMQVELAERSSRPIVHVPVAAPLPLPELQRPVAVIAEREQPVLTSSEPPAPLPASKPARRSVVVTRGRVLAADLPAPRAVDLSTPQPLVAPRRPAPEPVQSTPAHEPELKRPSFE